MQSNDSKGKKGKVQVYKENGRLKVRLPRQYFEKGEQPRYALNMEANEFNWARAEKIAQKIQFDLEDNCFDESLEKYGINKKVKKLGNTNFVGIVTSSLPTPSLSTLDIYDIYLKYKENNLAITTYHDKYNGTYRNAIKQSLDKVNDSAIAIYRWLIENKSASTAKSVLSALDSAYQLALKQQLITHNPFLDLWKDIDLKQINKTISQQDKLENDIDILDKTKCYTWEESLIIREYIKCKSNISHWYHIVSFRFLTGCRPGEAYGLWYGDIQWDKECIIIRRSYASSVKKHKCTKNNRTRLFPMPKDGELWNLLKELPQGDPNEVVFKTKTGKQFNKSSVDQIWNGNSHSRHKGIIPELIKQGKLKQHFPFYNCRHTFVTHQIFDLGREPEIVNAWCEHSDTVSRKHYRDVSSYAMQANPEVHASHNQNLSEIEILKKQNEELMRRLEKLEREKSDS